MLRRLFGDDVAENDAQLSEYFIETPAYRMALSGEKRFIIGRKGAGKSAICQQLQKQLPQERRAVRAARATTHPIYRFEAGLE